jgi:hypothetical protein
MLSGLFLSQFCDTEILANCLPKKKIVKLVKFTLGEKKISKISPKKPKWQIVQPTLYWDPFHRIRASLWGKEEECEQIVRG